MNKNNNRQQQKKNHLKRFLTKNCGFLFPSPPSHLFLGERKYENFSKIVFFYLLVSFLFLWKFKNKFFSFLVCSVLFLCLQRAKENINFFFVPDNPVYKQNNFVVKELWRRQCFSYFFPFCFHLHIKCETEKIF